MQGSLIYSRCMWSCKAETRVQGKEVGTEVHYKTGVTLGLAHTPSMITLGCLDGGDERGEGQGLLL